MRIMTKRLFPLCLVAMLAACSAPAEHADQPANAGPDSSTATSEADCLREGGEWRQLGKVPVKQCLRQTTDAGKACTDTEQCEGLCIAPEGTVDGAQVGGQCSTDTNRFGCRQRVVGGVARTLCVD